MITKSISCFQLIFFSSLLLHAQSDTTSLNNSTVLGYKGIWFELNQKYPFGDKYSGGLGTYTAKHMPMAIYAEAVDKTFFVYGGTTDPTEKHLLCMVGFFDHKTETLPRPTVVYDKKGVDDPHDNPSLLIDGSGYLWVFVSGRGRKRPGFKFRSRKPYDIGAFDEVSEEEMTYPQPWYDENLGFFHFFTKYTGVRELYFEVSADGHHWTEDQKIAGIIEDGFGKAGHYQVTGKHEEKMGTFFNRHKDGHPDTRTDLYYLQTVDFGKTWQNVASENLSTPLTKVENKALVVDYQSNGQNVYLKDMRYDRLGHPICLYITSGGHEPGPENQPYQWKITKWDGANWNTFPICNSDHNYDMGSLYLTDSSWYVIGPTKKGPQEWAAGGEIAIWESLDQGLSWTMLDQITKNSHYNHTYVRRPLNAKSPFLFYWADGDPTRFSQSHLYFGDISGQFWKLPYDMPLESMNANRQ